MKKNFVKFTKKVFTLPNAISAELLGNSFTGCTGI